MPISTKDLRKFDDVYWTSIFTTVALSGEEFIKDCGTYSSAINTRQLAYKWREAAEKDFQRKERSLSSPAELDLWVRMMADEAIQDNKYFAQQWLARRRRQLDLAQTVKLRVNKGSSKIIFGLTKILSYGSKEWNDLSEYVNRVKDKLPPDSDVLALFEE